MSNLILDLSKWNGANLYSKSFFDKVKNYGVKSASVQLTVGTDSYYDNVKAPYQVYNAYKAFGLVGAYHFYYGNAVPEARYFLSHVKQFGLDTTTPLMMDFETSNIGGNWTNQINAFMKVLYDAGYHNLWVYSGASLFQTRINVSRIKYARLWVAAYNDVGPGINNAGAWQFTESYLGYNLDCSYDFTGKLTMSEPSRPPKPKYWKSGKLFKLLKPLNIYADTSFKQPKRERLGAGTVLYSQSITKGHVPRILIHQGYISANTQLVKKIK